MKAPLERLAGITLVIGLLMPLPVTFWGFLGLIPLFTDLLGRRPAYEGSLDHPFVRSTSSTLGLARSAAAMWVRWRASLTSMSMSTSKKSD